MKTKRRLYFAALAIMVLVAIASYVYAQNIPGTTVMSQITTGNSNATYSIGNTREMQGTPKNVADLATRDAITPARREEGMACWVISEAKNYRLVGGIGNANWIEDTAAVTNTVIYATSNFVFYSFTTNLTVVSNAYFFDTNFFNYSFTTNLTVVSNAYFFKTNFVNYSFTTNLTVVSNAYFLNTNFIAYNFTTNLTVVSNSYSFATNFDNYNFTTNLTVVSNASFFSTNFVNYSFTTNLTVQIFYSLTNLMDNLIVTNSITNLSLTAGQFVATDAYKRLVSTLDGGPLTNLTFFQATNAALTTTLTAGLAYTTNMAGALALGNFAGVPSDKVWSIYLLATNASGGNLTLTFPSGCSGMSGLGLATPPVYYVTNQHYAIFQVHGWGVQVTNVSWEPH